MSDSQVDNEPAQRAHERAPRALRRLWAWSILAALVALATSMLAPGSSAHAARKHHGTAKPRVTPDPLASGKRVALGVTLGDPMEPTLDAFAALAGVRPRLVMWYQSWQEPLYYRSQMNQVRRFGSIPIITWDPLIEGQGIPLAAIAGGAYDRYINSAARSAARWKHRIYIRFGHEMNLPGALFGRAKSGNTPAEFVAAWRHVVRIFRRNRATNVEWVWSPNVDCDGKCPFTAYYPGDAWVDWVALDGYNYAAVDHVPWMTFAHVFGSSYRVLARMTAKPMMIGETSSDELGGNKAAWIRGIGAVLQHRFKRVRALVWFERVKETNWTIDSSPATLAAFRALVSRPPFQLSVSAGTRTSTRAGARQHGA